MPRKTLFHERNAAIKEDFFKLKKDKKMMSSAAVEMLSKKYFLNEGTISNIVYELGRYKEKPPAAAGDQLAIFQTHKS